jgi:flagellar basal-body rod protein FlgC
MGEGLGLIPAVSISTTGLDAQTRRMEATAQNIANANTTVRPGEVAVGRQEVILAAKFASVMRNQTIEKVPAGVEIRNVVETPRDPKKVFRPGHPDADAEGFVRMSGIDPLEEMVEMMNATRAYEANLSAIRAGRTMAQKALEIGK